MRGKLTCAMVVAFVFGLGAFGFVNEVSAQEGPRIERLEKRLDEQDAKMDRILGILESQHSGQATAPEESKPAAAPAKPATVSKDEYTPGWILRIYSAPEGFEVSSGLPPTELGSLEANKAEYGMDASSLLGVTVNGCTVWRGEGFLLAPQQGNYTFVLNIDNASTVYGSIRVDGKEIYLGKDAGTVSFIGGAELNPGLHTVEFRLAGGLSTDFRSSDTSKYGTFTVSIKGPDDSSPKPASEVLLRKIKK